MAAKRAVQGAHDGTPSDWTAAPGDCRGLYSWLEHQPGTPVHQPQDGLLNTSDPDAHFDITISFSGCAPASHWQAIVPARRTNPVRLNDLTDPQTISHETDDASAIEADIPIVVQHTRLDSRQAENTLITTIAYPGEA